MLRIVINNGELSKLSIKRTNSGSVLDKIIVNIIISTLTSMMKESSSNFEMTEDKLIEDTETRRVDISEASRVPA